MAELPRRGFLALALAAARPPHRVAVIGHTGRGNYGHGLDAVFRGLPNATIVALADPDPDGRARALARSGAPRGYPSYQEMLQTEKPDIAVIAPRWLDQRVPMVEAASAAGAHLLMEKAFAATLDDADRMVRAIGNRKVQVCHTARLAPATLAGLQLLRDGAIGEILEITARGKEDRRAGGEDMLTLGSHCFDLMRLIAGNPTRCFARVTGPPSTPTENIGPVAGHSITATFEFPNAIPGHFASQRHSGPDSLRYGVTVLGSTGAIAFHLNPVPNTAWINRSPSWRGPWEPIPAPNPTTAETMQLLAADLLAAIEQDRQPACTALDGLWTIEMIQAVYASSLAGAPITLPLKNRRHPLL